ncbi:MAG: metallophosphoesterase family protein [Bacteroidota bacterium]
MASPRLLALGDIHGCLRALTTLALHVPFRPADTLVALGDYVNRGSNSAGVLDWFIAWNKQNHLVPLLGNHDWMMLQRRAVDSEVPDAHWTFLESDCRPWYESERHLFVHAGVDPALPMTEQDEQTLLWNKLEDRGPHVSGKRVICGHTSQRSGKPLDLGHTVCIDTRVYADGWLTCLDVATNAFWQANEQGATRSGTLAGGFAC